MESKSKTEELCRIINEVKVEKARLFGDSEGCRSRVIEIYNQVWRGSSEEEEETSDKEEILYKNLIDDLDNKWQKLAFTLYDEIVNFRVKLSDLYKLIEKEKE